MIESIYGIDRLKRQAEVLNEEQQKALDAECALYAQCFSTHAGKKVLSMLEGELENQTWNPDKNPNWGYYMEGQQDALRFIINRIKYAKRDKK